MIEDLGDSNTLIILRLSRKECDDWKAKLCHWDTVDEVVALPSFGRVLVICPTRVEVAALMEELHRLHSNLSLVYGPQMTSAEPVSRLEVPKIERLLFISPPCSPPAGWLSTVEEPPNARTHFEQELNARLIALSQLHAAESLTPAKPDLQLEIPKTTIIVEGSETTPTISVNLAAGNGLDSEPMNMPHTSMPV